jgi:hypothetical protein
LVSATPRRFPAPWEIDDNAAVAYTTYLNGKLPQQLRQLGGSCFIVRDHSGQALAYVYYEDEPGRLGNHICTG